MRREGYEFAVSKAEVLYKYDENEMCIRDRTGTTLKKEQLQVWVDYANKNGSVIIFDAAYELSLIHI